MQSKLFCIVVCVTIVSYDIRLIINLCIVIFHLSFGISDLSDKF